MQSTRNDLAIRKEETTELLRFIEYLENSFSPSEEIGCDILSVKTSIKANIVLMLYNAVESTVTSCLKRIHEKVNAKGLKYDELTTELQKLMAVYYGYAIEKSPNVDNKMDIVLRFASFVNGSNNFDILYDELAKKYQLYSGNLDSKEINNVLKKYGIMFDEKCSELQTIKRDRNILAHGEKSFEEVGRDLSIPQLKEMTNRALAFLEKMIDKTDEFLQEEKFIRSNITLLEQ